ncbi:hypothetical protein C810_03473 [Lachnospiraceae bacterium A2]|nr:hypothetical protein C810_03473 [Lachnospiraceae bacterium A2]
MGKRTMEHKIREGRWLKKGTVQRKKAKFGIMMKIVAIGFIPMLILAVSEAAFSSRTIRKGMRDEAIKRLEDITVGLEEALNVSAEGDYHVEGGELYKGERSISNDLHAFQAFADFSDIDLTVCWGDTRMVTTLLDHDTGENMAGTKVSETVAKIVLQDGFEFTDIGMIINGEPYFCCYRPLKNSDGSVVGMVFAGEHSNGIEEYIDKQLVQITVLNIAIILLASVVIYYFSRTLAKAIRKEEEVLRQLAEGSLNVEVDQKLLGRRDELGGIALALQDLVQKLSTIIKHIQQSSGELMESGQSLDEMAERVNENATEISRAVEEISSGAATQSEEIETASGQIMDMGSVIESIVKDVGQLNDTSKTMKEAGDTSAEIMKGLAASTDRTNEAIQKIGAQVYATNESAQKIRAAVDIISSIASQTSLLSLNASIEAARAGEFGKGFAVVASEIQKLADESSNSAQTITDVINSLLEDSEMTVEIMKEVEEIIIDQREKLVATQSHFVEVETGINNSREGASMIEQRTHVCDESRKTVVEVISNLSALSQENAASAQQTTASMEELNDTIQLLAGAANSLRNMSDRMEEEMKFFKL